MKRLFVLLFVVNLINTQAQTVSYDINRCISASDTLLVFESSTFSYGAGVDGCGELLSDTAYIRIILVDNLGREWLMYEKNDLYSTEGNVTFQGAAFETSILDSIVPKMINCHNQQFCFNY